MKKTGILRLLLGKKPKKVRKARKKKKPFGLSVLDFLCCRCLDILENQRVEKLWKPNC
ncbi:MAG: hypothetical protein K6C08_07395 [Oscillospiraceae bacterium]|nr:hypothetical protein [Oscillospiraceae bacterium]